MPLLCISLRNHETTVKLPSDISSQDAILRMVSYDQHKKAGGPEHYPSWEIDLKDILGSSHEVKNSPGDDQSGNARLPLPNCHPWEQNYTTEVGADTNTTTALSGRDVIYPNVKFHLGHIGVDGGKVRVYHAQKGTSGDLIPFRSADDVVGSSTVPDWQFREIKLYFEYQTNDPGPSNA